MPRQLPRSFFQEMLLRFRNDLSEEIEIEVRAVGFIKCTASVNGKVFLLLRLGRWWVGDVSRTFLGGRDKLLCHQCPGWVCTSLTPGDASAGGSWARTGNVDQSSTRKTFFFTWRLFWLNSPSRRHVRVAWRRRRRRGGIWRDCHPNLRSRTVDGVGASGRTVVWVSVRRG